MKDLTEIRKDLDKIDNEIKELYLKRMSLVDEVAQYKASTGKQILDTKREQEKIEALTSDIGDDFTKRSIVELYEQIMAVSRKKQYRMLSGKRKGQIGDFVEVDELPFDSGKIVFQGVWGAYSQIATETFFGKRDGVYHVPTWREAIEELMEDRADYAVLPIENSTAGAVYQNYDLLAEYDVTIVGEQIIEAAHCLLGVEGADISDIKTIYSHPQALMQCDRYLREHFSDASVIALENTAVSAEKVKNDGDKTQAAIAGKINGEIYGLKILDEKIQDEKYNHTRFMVLSKKKIYVKNATGISLCFCLPHTYGSLYRALSHFIFNGINMSRIESRPIHGKEWEYRFFIDIEGRLSDEGVQNALTGLFAETDNLRILGNYGSKTE